MSTPGNYLEGAQAIAEYDELDAKPTDGSAAPPHGGLKVGDLVRHGEDMCLISYVYDGADEIGLVYRDHPDDGSFEVCWFDVELLP